MQNVILWWRANVRFFITTSPWLSWIKRFAAHFLRVRGAAYSATACGFMVHLRDSRFVRRTGLAVFANCCFVPPGYDILYCYKWRGVFLGVLCCTRWNLFFPIRGLWCCFGYSTSLPAAGLLCIILHAGRLLQRRARRG